MFLRDFSQDFKVFREVFLDNEYRLPDRFGPRDVIVDVGAHIGCFALACIQRGAQKVVCVEPEPNNFQLLRQNLGLYDDLVQLHRAALWRSDGGEDVWLARPLEKGLTAMSQVRPRHPGQPRVRTVGLDELLEPHERVALLKLDCEGGEYPGLYTCTQLARVERIVGESHEQIPWQDSPRPCSLAHICGFLAEQGFAVEAVLHNEYVNNFYAIREESHVPQ